MGIVSPPVQSRRVASSFSWGYSDFQYRNIVSSAGGSVNSILPPEGSAVEKYRLAEKLGEPELLRNFTV
jgi:hypothetical protein